MPDDVIDAPVETTESIPEINSETTVAKEAPETVVSGSELEKALSQVDFSSLDDFDKPASKVKPEKAAKEPVTEQKTDKVTPKVEGTPAVVKAPEVAPVKGTIPVDDKDIDSIEARPGSRPEIQDQIKNLKSQAKEARAYARDTATQLTNIQTELAGLKQSGAVPPDEIKGLRDRIAQLEHYEYLINPEASTYLTKEFDTKISAENDKVYNILKSLNIPEKPWKIKDENGKETDVDGLSIEGLKSIGGPLAKDFGWWEQYLLKNDQLPALERKRLEQALLSASDLGLAKKSAAAAAPEKLQQFVKEKQVQSERQEETRITGIVNRVKELLPQVPYGSVRAISATATPEERAEIEEANKFHEEAKILFARVINPANPKEAADVATGFIHGLWTERRNEKLQAALEAEVKRADEAEGRLTGIKKAGSTRAPNGAPTVSKPSRSDAFFKTPEDNFSGIED